jgi:hypothetical protein
MTTSKGALPVSYYTETPGEKKSLEDFLRIQDELEKALTNRQQLFDPVLLAMAQGFLAPTKTGKFGEALGNVAAQVAPAQQAEEKRMLENIAMRRDLAASKLGAQQASRDEEMLRKLFKSSAATPAATPTATPAAEGATPPAAPTEGVPATEPVAGAPLASKPAEAQATAAPVRGLQEGSTLDQLTGPQLSAMAISNNPRVQALAKFVLNLRKDDRENLMVVGGNLVDTRTKEVVFTGAEEQKPYTLPGVEGQFLMTPSEYRELIGRVGNLTGEARDQAVRDFVRGRQTKEQIEASGERAKERAKGDVKLEEAIFADAKVAPDLIRSADTLIQLATNPNTKGTFGILAQSGFLGALGQLGENTLRVGSYNIGIPSIEQAIRTATRSPAEIRAAELASAASTTLELNFRKLFYKGEGNVSNMEAEVVRQLGGSIKDTPEGIVAKAQMIKLRSEFDRKAADVFRAAQKRGISVRDFKDTDEYKTAVKEYDDGIQTVRDSIINFQPAASGAPAGGRPAAGAAARPAERTMPDGSVWVLQPDGSYKLKKK